MRIRFMHSNKTIKMYFQLVWFSREATIVHQLLHHLNFVELIPHSHISTIQTNSSRGQEFVL